MFCGKEAVERNTRQQKRVSSFLVSTQSVGGVSKKVGRSRSIAAVFYCSCSNHNQFVVLYDGLILLLFSSVAWGKWYLSFIYCVVNVMAYLLSLEEKGRVFSQSRYENPITTRLKYGRGVGYWTPKVLSLYI